MMRTLLLILFTAHLLPAAERPNILWLTSEDNDKQWLGCYGNEKAQTPHLDALAKRAIRFENFFSNAPVCAVARSTILTGVYAPSQGTQHMRSRHPIPARNKPYVTYLREAGYYCSNASKTDFNFAIQDKSIWDECNPRAHYKNRKEGQPFFAIFNFTESHESSLFEEKIASRRESGQLPPTPRLQPAEVEVPPYLPDLPEVRSDIALYHDNVTLMDQRVGKALAELEERGLAEDTIIFYYSDHGGVIPRGKRYLKDTGVNVPLLIHVPERWQHLSPLRNGTVTEECAAFVDLAPTLLSLLDLAKPEPMQGRALLGSHREEPPENEVFLFADRFDEIYGMRRGVTDGRWKYIRRFTPHYPAAPYSYYQFGQKAWGAWRKAWQEGKLDGRLTEVWEKSQPVEELFDTEADRWEIQNLADDPAHADHLAKMRAGLKKQMIAVLDTGLVPEPMFAELAPQKPIADYVKSREKDWPAVADLAFLATERQEDNLPQLIEKLSSPDPLQRYWAAQGCLILGEKAAPAEEELRKLLGDTHSATRATAAQSLIAMGSTEGAFEALLKELSETTDEYNQQNVFNILSQLDALARIPNSWIYKNRGEGNRNYVERLADQLAKDRGL